MKIMITGMHRVLSPKPNYRGDTILAYCDVRIEDWLTIKGLILVRLESGGLSVWEPRLEADRMRRSVKMSGKVRREVAEAAFPFYEQLGGVMQQN